jgi:ribosomal protein S18 acetylase RimI-like enzyme
MTRRAGPGDVRRLAGVLARAFADDPVMSWVFPHDATRLAWNRRFFRFRLRSMLRQDEVWTTDDGAGAALWAGPERWRLGARETLGLARFVPATGRRTARLLRGLSLIEARHPETPHWYLAVLGTEPSRQRKGIGSRLLAPVLDACDADEVPAYLESSSESNIAFYARHGFRVTEEVRLLGGPPVWLMWRDPRP